jgi:exo-beta-1,3-glucanase (GH17 family)
MEAHMGIQAISAATSVDLLAQTQATSGTSAAKPAGGPPPSGGAKPTSGTKSSSSSSSSSATKTYDARDTNKDGVVSFQEQIAYDLKQVEENDKSSATYNQQGQTKPNTESLESKISVTA